MWWLNYTNPQPIAILRRYLRQMEHLPYWFVPREKKGYISKLANSLESRRSFENTSTLQNYIGLFYPIFCQLLIHNWMKNKRNIR